MSTKAHAKRVAFANAFIACNRNGTEAAIRAGLTTVRKKANRIAGRYAADPEVQALIAERTEKAMAPLKLSADEVLGKLAQLVRLNPKRLFDEFGDLRPIHELPDEVAECIDAVDAEIIVRGRGRGDKVEVTKIRLSKKATAVEMAMRHHGMFPREQGGGGDPEELARLVRERLGQIDELTGGKPGEKKGG